MTYEVEQVTHKLGSPMATPYWRVREAGIVPGTHTWACGSEAAARYLAHMLNHATREQHIAAHAAGYEHMEAAE